MTTSSRTPEGLPNECAVCGKRVWVVPSQPPGDATCPHCGSAVWFSAVPETIPDVLHLLRSHGAIVETDAEEQVKSIRLVGSVYNDRSISQLKHLRGVKVIDIRKTSISEAGADHLRNLLPETTILSRADVRQAFRHDCN